MMMVARNDGYDGPAMNAARKALETGNVHHILIWIPEESENTVKNLLERAYCECSTKKDGYDRTVDWYFKTVSHLHSEYRGHHHLNITLKRPEDYSLPFLVGRACECGNFEEISRAIKEIHHGEMRQRFNDLMRKKNFNVNNIAAGREYVTAFTEFIALVENLRQGVR